MYPSVRIHVAAWHMHADSSPKGSELIELTMCDLCGLRWHWGGGV